MDVLQDLPSDLVRNLLMRGSEVAKKAAAQATTYAEKTEKLREAIFKNRSDDYGPGIWSLEDAIIDEAPRGEICAVDGAVVCDNRAIGDFCAAVGISVGEADGNTDNEVFLESVPRSVHNKEVTSGIMSSLEIEVAARAKGDVILLDGAFIATLINVSKAINIGRSMPTGPLRDRIMQSTGQEFREHVLAIMTSSRYLAVPKYVTKNDFGTDIPEEFRSLDSRSVADMALKAGELTKFAPATDLGDPTRNIVGSAFGFSKSELAEFTHLIEGIHSCYYKPHEWTPAFRIDIPLAVAQDYEAQARILRAIRDSTRASGMQEPLPQYLVDLFAKRISDGVNAVVEMSALASVGDPKARMLMAMRYRT